MPPFRKPSPAIRQIELIHTSLGGLLLMCMVLTAGLLLPVFGFNGLSSPLVAACIIVTVAVGAGALYAQNLGAHRALLDQARLTEVLINSLGQGFLSFDAKGACGPVYSQACHALLCVDDVADRPVTEVLRVTGSPAAEFVEWLDILFMQGHALSFEDAVRFLPDRAARDDARTVELTYRPVRDKEGLLTRVVLIATDRTEEMEAQKRADQERQFAAMVCAIFAERPAFAVTMKQISTLLERLTRFDEGVLAPDFFREVHTAKGAALHFKMDALATALHGLEQELKTGKSRPLDEARSCIDSNRALVQREFGRIQNTLRDIAGADAGAESRGLIEVDEESIYRFARLLKQHNVSPDLIYAYQAGVLSVPLFGLLKTLDRHMLPLAERLEKRVRPISFTGEDVRLPARPLQPLLLALTHVVRNVVDHGIEPPLSRMAKGKDPQGSVVVDVRCGKSDSSSEDWLIITISDDGAGIDPNKVRERLSKLDPEGDWRFDDDTTVIQQLLTRGFSTKEETSLLSGRGAGLAAVYQQVLNLGGRARLVSEMHKGTRLTVELPARLKACE